MASNGPYYMGATQIALPALGASVFPTLVKPPQYCMGGFVQRISGGSLEIMPSDLAGKTISGATAGGLGFLLGGSLAILPFEGPTAFYLAATGSTAVAGILWKFSEGATLN
jgi:hypothetical protein